jgi:hypothetical protein
MNRKPYCVSVSDGLLTMRVGLELIVLRCVDGENRSFRGA